MSERRCGFGETREELLRFYAEEADDHPVSRVPDHSIACLELPKLELERGGGEPSPVNEGRIRRTIRHVESRKDCADFGLNVLLRLLYRYPESARLGDELRDAIVDAALEFAYWFDEPGDHEMWFSTENHQILFHAAELLVAQRFPDAQFKNDERTGRSHRRSAEARVKRWLDWRSRFGYSEWLSNSYYDEDVLALVNLVDFASDEGIREAAQSLLDLTLFEVAVNSHCGMFGASHGRTYARHVLDPACEPMSPIQYLCWGRGTVSEAWSIGAIGLVTSDYQLPRVVRAIGRDTPPEFESREHLGLSVEDAKRHGLDPSDPDDQLFFWGSLVMGHRDVAETALAVCPERYRPRYAEIEPAVAYHADRADDDEYAPDPNNTAMTGADVYTFRVPTYMLSCAQDYRKGKFGFQQHIWQATLDGGALAYTNHPKASAGAADVEAYWGGNGLLPRAAAYRGVLCCLYRVGSPPHAVPDVPGFDESLAAVPYTHAFFPRARFDEVRETDDWVFGRRGGGYVGLTSPQPTRWADPREVDADVLGRAADADYELVAEGKRTAWVCELGNRNQHGSFEAFVHAVADATIEGDATHVRYDSPTLGQVEFAWEGPFVVDGWEVPLDGYPRFDNPYCTAGFDTSRYEISHDGDELVLSFDVDPPNS